MKQYPYLSDRIKTQAGGLCALCGHPMANMKLIIEINVMRGDDDVVKVHRACVYRKNSATILAALAENGIISRVITP
ncbi:MAG TPA: hypothetical protein VLA24_09380 [Pseudomonadales bacterium]|nr:hypothetical protein [Pseudomonadales bacterium]